MFELVQERRAKKLGPDLEARFYAFDAKVEEPKDADLAPKSEPKGSATGVGTALIDVANRQEQAGRKTARIIVVSDFASNFGFNPMTAARMVEPLGAWRRFRPELGALMKAELERIAATTGLSKNVFELVSRALA